MNCIQMIGVMGKNAKLETTPTQRRVCTFTLGINSMRKDKATGKNIVDWFPCEAWGDVAERIYYSLEFHDLVAIQGHMYNKKYVWNKKNYDKTIIVVDIVTFTNPRKAFDTYRRNINGGMSLNPAENAAANENDGYTIDNSNGNTDLEGIDW